MLDGNEFGDEKRQWYTEGNSRHLELMRIVRHADRHIAANGPSEGWGCLSRPPRPLLSAMNSNVDAIIVMRRSRRRQAAGGPPVVFLLQVAHHAAR